MILTLRGDINIDLTCNFNTDLICNTDITVWVNIDLTCRHFFKLKISKKIIIFLKTLKIEKQFINWPVTMLICS